MFWLNKLVSLTLRVRLTQEPNCFSFWHSSTKPDGLITVNKVHEYFKIV